MEVMTFFNSVKNLVTIQIIAGNGSKQSFGSGISNWKKIVTEKTQEKHYNGILLLVRLFSLFMREHGPSVCETPVLKL